MPVARGETIDPARTRARVVATLEPLLYEHGIDGIGVSALCEAAGISKETLYRHFGSKDGLVEAVLQQRSDRVLQWLHAAASGAGDDPADQLAAIFDALDGWYAEPAFRGCAIVNASTQGRGGTAPGVAEIHLDRYRDLFRAIAVRAGSRDPDLVATQLLVVVEGATVVSDQLRLTGAAAAAKDAALALLRASL